MGARAFVLTGLVVAGCGGGGGFPDARPIDAANATATFSLDWSVADTANQPISCDRIAAQSVTVLTHNIAVEGGQTQVFSCSSGTGTSGGMMPGTYEFQFQLVGDPNVIDPNQIPGSLLATGPAQTGIVLTANQNTRLAPVAFAVEATGAVSLTVSSGQSGGNCGSTGSNGAGITGTTITLVHNSDGTCNPLALNISASTMTGQSASTYTIDCATPVQAPCIETDQTITATGVAADSYTIHVRGKLGGSSTPCWFNNDSLPVPPLGLTLTRQLNLAMGTGNQCT